MSARSGVIEMLPAPTAARSVPGAPESSGCRSSSHQYGTPRGSSPGCAVNRSGGYEPARVTWVPAISLAGNDGKLMLRNVLTRAAMSWPSNAGRYPSTPPHSSGFPGPGATLSAAPLSAAGGSPRSAASRPAPQVPEYMMSPARLGPRLTPDSTRSGGRSSRALRPRATQSAGVPSTANSRSLSCRARNGWGREIELEAPDRSAAGATVHTSSLTESAAVLSFCSPIAPMPSSLTRRSRGLLTRLPYRSPDYRTGGRSSRSGISSCGRGMTWAETTLPTASAAAFPASTAAWTAPTSPATMIVIRPPPTCCLLTRRTLAALTMASAASVAPTRPNVSTMPRAWPSISAMTALLNAAGLHCVLAEHQPELFCLRDRTGVPADPELDQTRRGGDRVAGEPGPHRDRGACTDQLAQQPPDQRRQLPPSR